jgi:hypothetical protein
MPGFSLLSWKAHNARTIASGLFFYLALLMFVSFPIAVPLTDYESVISPIASLCTLPGLIMFSQSYQNPFDSMSSSRDARILAGFVTIICLHLAFILIMGQCVRDIDTPQQVRNYLIIASLIFLGPSRIRGYLAAAIVQFALLSWIIGSREPVQSWSVFFLPDESTFGWQLLAFLMLGSAIKLCVQVSRLMSTK